MSRMCVTGCAGFVGSTLADRLIAEGHEILGVDNYLTGKKENVVEEVRMAPGGLLSSEAWFRRDSVEPCDLIVHCAASYSDQNNWQRDISTNIDGARMVADLARHWNARIFYFQTVLPPISSYAISKIAGEHYLCLSGQPLTVFRLASIYGPRLLSGAIPAFYRAIKAGEPCTVVEGASRDFVFIDDLVDRVVLQATFKAEDGSWAAGPGVYEVRTGTETSIVDIPNMIGEIFGVEPTIKLIPRPENDVAQYEMDGVPRVGTSFKEGLAKTIAWYEENGVGETYSHLGVLSG